MIRAMSILTIAGLASTSFGQNYILRLEGGPQEIDTTTGSVTFTIDVIGDAEAGLGTHMLWGSLALESSGSSLIQNISWVHADWSEYNIDGGYAGNGVYNHIEFGQWETTNWTPRVGSELGERIGSFQISLAQGDDVSGMLDFNLLATSSFGLSTIDIDTGASYYSSPESLVFEGFSIQLVPAPGSALVLMGSILLCTKRRR